MAKKLVFSNNPLLSGPAMVDRERSGVPYREVPLSAIERDPNQPRVIFDDEKLEELSQSIKTYGILNPILVRSSGLPGKYTIVAGERRFRAAGKAGLAVVPVIVDTERDDSGERTLAIQLVENIQRAELAPLERAHAISALKEAHSLSIRDVADKIGISKSMVQRSLDLLDLPDDLINALRQGTSESKILLLAKVSDVNERARLLKDIDSISRDSLNLKVVQKAPSKSRVLGKAKVVRPEDQRIADEIQRSIGLKVALTRSASDSESGKLMIDFYSEEDLQELFRKLVNE